MITRFLTEVRVAFNPFSPRSKPARLFLSLIPANARASGMTVQSKLLPRTSKDNATLDIKFSTCLPWGDVVDPIPVLTSALPQSSQQSVKTMLTKSHRGRQGDEHGPEQHANNRGHGASRPTLAHAGTQGGVDRQLSHWKESQARSIQPATSLP